MSPGTTTDDEALYRRACEIASRKPSVAYLQRSLGGGIGYVRTTALLNRMVAEGVIAGHAGRRPSTATPAPPATEVFEFWWADHMPNATQTEAWAEWCALNQDEISRAELRDRLRHALLDGGVVLDQKRLVLIFDPRQPGDNILQQVLDRLQSCWPTANPQEHQKTAGGPPP